MYEHTHRLVAAATAEAMDRVNPMYIPRIHVVGDALAAATTGDLAPYERLVDAIVQPYAARHGLDDPAQPGPADDVRVTYCGT